MDSPIEPRHPLEVVMCFQYGFECIYENKATEKAAKKLKEPMETIEFEPPLEPDSFRLLPVTRGFSLHAAHNIPKWVCLLEVTGVIREGPLDNNMSFPLGNGLFVDSGDLGNLARFVQYNCDANCELHKQWKDGECKLFLYSIRPVQKLEALTYRFTYNYGENEKKLECNCGSKYCTKVVGETKNSRTVLFACHVCDKTFKRKGHLLEHIPTHDKDRKIFKCHLCDASYVDQRGLNRHMRTKHYHKKSSFQCPHCDKAYQRKDTLDYHLRNSHPNIKGGKSDNDMTAKIHKQEWKIEEPPKSTKKLEVSSKKMSKGKRKTKAKK